MTYSRKVLSGVRILQVATVFQFNQRETGYPYPTEDRVNVEILLIEL